TLGLMAQKGDRRVASATFFTTLTDFSEQGEFTPFLQNDFVDGITAEVDRAGVFAAQLMSRTMSFLRANDLVWGPAIRSYMMGETPPAFDLLYWNGDATNLPGKMTVDYLRGLCQQNLLVDEGFPVLGHNVTLKDITLPLCAIGCETDHIAPWKYSWRGVAQMGSPDKRFILSESGHIAGIINPPSKKKYGHYAGGEDFSAGPEAWREASGFQPGSWWPTWEAWLAGHSGAMVPARAPDDGFGPAPGTYVHERA
ncbi:MAG: class I poly(R)-hydroxyalkanoic acid synthase, partial [Paracoccus sp. (in: a-proteobacteria)]|nr:class I poly(R)-hydroxyalkanoic acid synthase [Paracoccus sp. (in: a-proteobacteria)]